jgi:hypothetical protein
MKETKTASGSPEARSAMHEMMAAFEAFKGANDARLDEIAKTFEPYRKTNRLLDVGFGAGAMMQSCRKHSSDVWLPISPRK